jgi:hypothetical protein
VKNLKISYYLLIISNLILKLLIAIYIFKKIFFFQFHPLEFDFSINFGLYFYNCYSLFPYYFLIKIFYLSNFVSILSNLVSIFLLLLILFEIIYEMLIIILLIPSSFNFFIF